MNERDRQGCLGANFRANVENIIVLALTYDSIPPNRVYSIYMDNLVKVIDGGRGLECGFVPVLTSARTEKDLEAISSGSESLKSEPAYQ
jgi:hypothetical protein